MRAVRDGGFEVGGHCWDHVRWQDKVGMAEADWTEREMRRALARFEENFFVSSPRPGAPRLADEPPCAWVEELSFPYASDTRGFCRFPAALERRRHRLPATSDHPAQLDELIGLDASTSRTSRTSCWT